MYKQTTQQTLTYIEQIEAYMQSEAYRNQISWQDITSNSSPYRHGDQTFDDWVNALKNSIKLIRDNLSYYDSWSYDQRNAICNSYLANIASWIQNPLGNYVNIIQHANWLISSLFSMWIWPWVKFPSNRELKKAIDELEKVSNITKKEEVVSRLIQDLQLIKESETKLTQAKDIISFVENNTNIKELDSYISNAKLRIDSLTENAQELISKASDWTIASHFSGVSESYEKELTFNLPQSIIVKKDTENLWFIKRIYYNVIYFILEYILVFPLRVIKGLLNWNFFVILGVWLFMLNLYLVIENKDDISIKVENQESILLQVVSIIANGLIRLTCLSPSIFLLWFILQNRNHKEKLRQTYEFRAVSSRTINWHIETLRTNWIEWDKLNEFIIHAFTNLYTEPDFWKVNQTDAKEKLLDVDKFTKIAEWLEKIKSVFK